MHCLPVRRNVELTDEVLDGPQSIVFTQATNRLYAAQAVLKNMIDSMKHPANMEVKNEDSLLKN
jgi:N-succinyl-L-ornithine transcarbamylase